MLDSLQWHLLIQYRVGPTYFKCILSYFAQCAKRVFPTSKQVPFVSQSIGDNETKL